MKTHPASVPFSADEPAAWMSALADGDREAAERGCELWRNDAGARATWHTYQLIGDVMRSDDLASTPGRDAAFLAALRTRLADEPVVLAPQPVAVSPRRRQRWLMPAAAAAGFVAVAGVLVVARMPAGDLDGPRIAVSNPSPSVQLADTQAQPPRQLVMEGRLIRDPRLDAYLEAHRQVFSGPAAAVPGRVPRNFQAAVPADAPAAAVPVSR